MPWKNGGGVTREVARWPQDGDDFAWRISIADVAAGGPFSNFPGIDRVIIRIGEAPLVLAVEGEMRNLERFVPFAFSGEAATSATLPHGATRDLNVMTRRDRITADVRVRTLGDADRLTPPTGARLAVIVLQGTVGSGSTELGEHDALVGQIDEPLPVNGAGALIVVATLG